MEELSLDRSELRRMQREQERERRRVRDRERRQSMTIEQRERHLARRRRNYQLRRLRAENAKAGDFPSQQISNEQDAAGSEGNNDVREVTQLENPTTERLQYSQCLEAAASRSSNLSKRLRLSHIRRLARSLNHLGGEVIGNHQIVADVIPKGDTNASCFRIGDFDSGRLPNGLRFNRVKRLARSINSSTNEASVNGPKVEQIPSAEEIRAIGDDKPKFGQSIDVRGEVEGPNMDDCMTEKANRMRKTCWQGSPISSNSYS
ncbi:hypothetical protein ACFX2C_005413 [Malus domestica]